MADTGWKTRDRSSDVGLFVAAASAPRSMQDGLMPRNTLDQGIVTGTTMAVAYLLGAIYQDVVDGATDAIINDKIERGVLDASTADDKRIQYTAVASGAALLAGLAGQRIFKQKEEEKNTNAILRTASYWASITGLAGLTVAAIEGTVHKVSSSTSKRRPLWPFIIPAGALTAISLDILRPATKGLSNQENDVKPLRALGIGVGVSLVLASFVAAEKMVAKQTNKLADKYFPVLRPLGIPVGHLVAFGGIVYGMREAIRQVMRKAEHGGSMIETGFATAPDISLVSGSAKSRVAWDTLSREGRRFVSTVTTPTDIMSVRKSKSAKQPIRVFVGLDSADSEEARVNLALAELERTKAYERELIVVASPTGTGYINYIMAESVEYCSNGNSAIVTLQYSKRPSPLSLDRVSYGHTQYRMLLNGMKKYLKEHPQYSPRIVLFGESLGAWTSQDAFMHQGTEGFEVLGVSAALWIGTPTQSTWKNEILAPKKRLDTDYEAVGSFNTTEDLMALSPKQRAKLRYVLLTNANDPIAKFGLRLLFQAPDWLHSESKDRFLTSVPRWRTPGTFIATMVDTKNALKPKPGEFVADGHDYRKTLLPFVNAIFGFNVPENKLPEIEQAMMRNEVERAKRMAA